MKVTQCTQKKQQILNKKPKYNWSQDFPRAIWQALKSQLHLSLKCKNNLGLYPFTVKTATKHRTLGLYF